MFITVTDASKGKPYRLSEQLEGCKIGIKSISGRIGWYNIKEELQWRYARQGGQPSDPITIEPGLYNFDSLVETLTGDIEGYEITVNKNTGKISLTVPANHQIWLPESVKKILGLDDEGWLSTGVYVGDHAVEFSPRRIEVYLNQLNTSKNLLNNKAQLNGSQFLGFVPLATVDFGDYFETVFSSPIMKDLRHGQIHELDFDFKVVWRDRTEKLDNHDQPLDLELTIE